MPSAAVSKPFSLELVALRDRRAVDPFDRQDALRRALPIDVGNAESLRRP